VSGLETPGLVGDMLALVGLVCGLPLSLIGWLWRSLEGPHLATEIVTVPSPDGPMAPWYAGGDFHERILRPGELHHVNGQDAHTGFISRTDPSRLRLEAQHRPTIVCLTLGGVFAGVGAVGFAASLIPLFLG
jgi:hypothetical protein